MALDPNIALQIKPMELVDPLASYGRVAAIQNAQNQNALAQYQLGAAQREEAAQNALSKAYQEAYDPTKGTYDINKLRGSLISAGVGAKLPDVEKKIGDVRSQQLTQQKLESELVDAKLKQARQFLDTINPTDPNAPAQYLAWHEANHRDPVLGPLLAARGITAESSRARIEQALATPGGFQNLLNQSMLGTEKFMELNKPQFITENLGGVSRVTAVPGLGGAPTTVSQTQRTATPGELMVDARARERLEFEKEKEKAPVFNPTVGGFVTKPTAANPQGGFTPLAGVQETKDQQAAVRALRSAGYDPTTGEDNISKLIKKSTSGGLEALTSGTLAFFGKTTEGRKAISALAGTANQIATDLAGGKLGAGISNTDRDFIVSALGDVANPSKTAEERLAGWSAAKERMRVSGLLPAPAKGKEAAVNAPAVGAVQDGYRFKGGNPADPSSWEKQ